MTATTRATGGTHASAAAMRGALADGWVITWRNLKRIPRIPELAIFAIFQSIMFVLLFAFVFGGAIAIPGYSDPSAYREYLMPGIFVQTIVFAAATIAIGMCDDINKGIVDRFRSLPMARSAVLTGRSVAEVVYNAGILVVLMVTGFLVGWTNHNGILALLAGRRRCSCCSPSRCRGSGSGSGTSVPSVEVAQQVSFTVLFPITFVSTAFVPLRRPAGLAPAVRRVEPGQHPDRVAARDLGEPEPDGAHDGLAGHPGADPGDAGLGRGDRRDLRAARHPSIPIAESLTCPRRGSWPSGWCWRCSSCCPPDDSSSPASRPG